MKYNILIVLVFFALSSLQTAASKDCNWQGNWYQDAWGCITLTQTSGGLHGDYTGGVGGTFDGLHPEDTENPCILIGTWHENNGNKGNIKLTWADGTYFQINFDHGSGGYETNGGKATSSCPK